MSTLDAILFKRALSEDLNKRAFVPLDKAAQQALGPDGAPVDPGSAGAPPGGAPMDPTAPPAPMDPAAAGGAPPMDPAAAGGLPPPPMDPAAAGGAPPMDPAAGAPPMDPSMGMPPEAPPMPDVNSAETDVDADGKPDTMVPLSGMKDFAIGLIEAMKGKKTQDAAVAEAEGGAAGAAGDVPPPPGPITGIPGDMSAMAGPMAGMPPIAAPKTASFIGRTRKA